MMRAIQKTLLLACVLPAATCLLPAAAVAAAKHGTGGAQTSKSGNYLVYVGTYTKPGASQGIYAWRFNAVSGDLAPLGLAAETTSPSFLAIHPSGKYLYAVGEVGAFKGQRAGSVSAFAIDKATGKLQPLNAVSSGGPGPCFVTVDATGHHVLVANYSGGSAAVIAIGDDGRLGAQESFVQHTGGGPDPRRQEAPHAHSINVSPDNRFAIVADLGLDKVMVYRFDAATGKITPNQPASASVAPTSGPRHFAFAPKSGTAYVINEMAQTVTAFRWDAAAGTLTEIGTVSSLPDGLKVAGNSTAEVLVHPSGKFVYGSNRGHDSIAVFQMARDGSLKLIQNEPTQGHTPRNFRIDPTGRWLFAANMDSASVVVFRIDPKTGRLTPAGKSFEVGSPVCIKFLPVD
jgi:6-phosphogluconolactonase